MKKNKVFALVLVMVLAMSLALTGCTGGNGSTSSAAPAASTPAASASTPAGGSEAAPTIDWPTKPISVVVPAGAGGDTDLNTRLFMKYLQTELGQTIVIQNVTGGGGSTGVMQMKDSAPDGYTMCVFHPGMLLNKLLGLVDYTYTDVEVINRIALDETSCWAINANAPYQTLAELVEYAKTNNVTFATEVGSMSHLTLLDFNKQAGIEMTIVDAGGAADKITALLGGNLDIMFSQCGLIADYVENGDFKYIGVLSAERGELFPDAPTFKEQGFDMVYLKPFWLMAPKGTDPAIIEKARDGIKAVHENSAYVEEQKSTNYTDVNYITPEDFMKQLEEINTMYAQIIEEAGIGA